MHRMPVGNSVTWTREAADTFSEGCEEVLDDTLDELPLFNIRPIPRMLSGPFDINRKHTPSTKCILLLVSSLPSFFSPLFHMDVPTNEETACTTCGHIVSKMGSACPLSSLCSNKECLGAGMTYIAPDDMLLLRFRTARARARSDT